MFHWCHAKFFLDVTVKTGRNVDAECLSCSLQRIFMLLLGSIKLALIMQMLLVDVMTADDLRSEDYVFRRFVRVGFNGRGRGVARWMNFQREYMAPLGRTGGSANKMSRGGLDENGNHDHRCVNETNETYAFLVPQVLPATCMDSMVLVGISRRPWSTGREKRGLKLSIVYTL